MVSVFILSLVVKLPLVNANDEVQGSIDFYTSIPDADAEQLVAAYNETYPNVEVNIFRSGTEELSSKIYAEKEAGGVVTDVVIVADAVTLEAFKTDDMLLEYRSPEAEFIPSEYVDPDGYYTGTKFMGTGIIYNTNNVAEAPTSWSVLTSEAATGNYAMPSPLYSGAAAYALGVITRNDGLGWEFYEALQANDPMVTDGNGAVTDAVATGQKDYGIILDYMALGAKANGSPVDFVYPEEGVPVTTGPIAIMADTDVEEIAQTFVDFVLSKEGQQLHADMGYAPIRPDVETPEGFASVSGETKVLEADIVELFENRETDKQQFDALFAQ